MKASNMAQAESMRYAKIQRLIDMLCKEYKSVSEDVIGNEVNNPFNVGKRITVEGNKIIIRSKTYYASELLKVTVNTEGSLAIYDRSGRKLCGWAALNLTAKNIERFCIWVRRNGVPAEVVSGRGEKTLQWVILTVAILVSIIIKILHFFYN